MADNKIGIYLCEGCGIAEAIDMDELEQTVSNEFQVTTCKRHAALCSDEGRAVIEKDIKDGEANKAVVAACSHRVMADRFQFENAVTVRANLREQIAWTQTPRDEDTNMFAADNVRMGIAQARNSENPEGHENVVKSEKLLVVGGGVAGLTAALQAARAGTEVTLVEKTGQLGGWTRKWSKLIPSRPPYRGLIDNNIEEIIKAVEDEGRITVLTNALVAKTEGMPGDFEVTIDHGGSEVKDAFGAIVVATGWRMPDDMSVYEKYGLGKVDGVMTGVDFEEVLANGVEKDGKKLETIAIIIPCESEQMPYTSGVADRIAIKQAIQVMDANPSAMVYVLHDNLRAHGQAEELYREAQDKGVVFMKAMVKSAEAGPALTTDDLLLGQEVKLSGLDAVVVMTGMMPNSTNPDLPKAEKGNEFLCDDVDPRVPITVNGEDNGDGDEARAKAAAASGDDDEGASVAPADCDPDNPPLPGGALINLQYRQGPHIPILYNGFIDSHYICFPYETRRTGIYVCGAVRKPMTVYEADNDATGAALKGIQAINLVKESRATHPRAGDLSYPNFGLDICTKCRRCTVECPFGAIDENEEGYPQLNPSRCRRCGTCMGACPVRTISFKNYSPNMVTEMIEAVEQPDPFDEKPRILVFACENDAYPALDMAGINRAEINKTMRFIPVRCLGSVTLVWVSNALEKGFDGVMLMGCKSGDDYQCHFVKGSAIAQERIGKVSETLKNLMLEEERVAIEEVSIADSRRIVELLNKFGDQIEEIGLNPFKGF